MQADRSLRDVPEARECLGCIYVANRATVPCEWKKQRLLQGYFPQFLWPLRGRGLFLFCFVNGSDSSLTRSAQPAGYTYTLTLPLSIHILATQSTVGAVRRSIS